jgi:hypothetical protein
MERCGTRVALIAAAIGAVVAYFGIRASERLTGIPQGTNYTIPKIREQSALR